MSDPYSPPGARVADPDPQQRGSTAKAVAIGFAVDVIGTSVFATLALVVIGVFFGARGMPPEELEAYLARSGLYQAFALALGAAFTALGGYVAARIANHAEYRHALYVGIASLVFGELVVHLAGGELEFWLRIAEFIVVLPAALFGGHMRVLQKTSTRQEQA